MKKIKVTIRGLAPILQARHPSPKEEEEILKRSKTAKKKVKDLTDKEAYDMHAYRTKGKKYYQPSEMIEAAMTKAAVNYRLEGKKTYKDLIKSGIIISPAELVHKNQKDWEMDARWGVNKNTRGAVWVVRPRLDNWELSFTMEILQDERIDTDIAKEILEYAGLYVGIGAWRPKFGRFEVIKWEVQK